MTVDPSKFDAATKKLEAEWGAGLTRRGNEYGKVHRIPFSSHELNWATFRGVPIGRWTRFFGGESTGKSLAAWDIAKNAQVIDQIYKENYKRLIDAAPNDEKKALKEELDEFIARFDGGMEVVYYNIEAVYHEEFIRSKGVDTDRIHIVEGNEIEKVCDAMQSYMSSAHLHIVDSTTAAIPLRILNGDVTDEHRGVDAARWKDGLRRVESHFDSEENTVIMISQTVIDQMTKAEVPVGGRKMNFSSSMSLHFKKGPWLYRTEAGMLTTKDQVSETISGLKEPSGIEATVRIAKSRVSPPFRTARVRLGFNENLSFDVLYEVFESAKFFGMVNRRGAWYYPVDENGEVAESGLQGEAKFREWMNENPEYVARVVDEMMNSATTRVPDAEELFAGQEDIDE